MAESNSNSNSNSNNNSNSSNINNVPRLILHGGAWAIPSKYEKNHIDGLVYALKSVYPLLLHGKISSVDAVEKAVNILEEDPTYDSGRGAFLNSIGEIELDAAIMNGRDLSCGSVAAIKNVLHPVSVARQLMDHPTEHNFLVASGANLFASTFTNVKQVDPKQLMTSRELKFYNKIKEVVDFKTKRPFEVNDYEAEDDSDDDDDGDDDDDDENINDNNKKSKHSDTVGAVAMDKDGNLAAATSTGGTPRKWPGRVGDSPLIGCGLFADNYNAACSATGFGESLTRVVFCKEAVSMVAQTGSASQAATKVVKYLQDRVQGVGGIIMIDSKGTYGFDYNTPKMAYAYANSLENGKFEIVAHIKHSQNDIRIVCDASV